MLLPFVLFLSSFAVVGLLCSILAMCYHLWQSVYKGQQRSAEVVTSATVPAKATIDICPQHIEQVLIVQPSMQSVCVGERV